MNMADQLVQDAFDIMDGNSLSRTLAAANHIDFLESEVARLLEEVNQAKLDGLDQGARIIGSFLTDPLTVHRNPEEVIREAMRKIREKMNAPD
jgi:hypothetical protein